jgi:hypothetical protein
MVGLLLESTASSHPHVGQRPQRGDGVRERLQMAVELDEPPGLAIRRARPEGGEGAVKAGCLAVGRVTENLAERAGDGD